MHQDGNRSVSLSPVPEQSQLLYYDESDDEMSPSLLQRIPRSPLSVADNATDSSNEIDSSSTVEPEPEFQELHEQINNNINESSTDTSSNDMGSSWDEDSSEDAETAANQLAVAFATVQAQTHCKHNVAKQFYHAAFKNRFRIAQAGDEWVSYRRGRTQLQARVPTVTMHHYFRSKLTGELTEPVIQSTLPEKEYLRNDEYYLEKTWSRVSIRDIMKCSDRCHKRKYDSSRDIPWKSQNFPPVEVSLSMDGIPLDNTSEGTLEVVSLKFHDCLRVWPIAIHIGKTKEKDLDIIFCQIINEISNLNIKVTEFLAD